MRGLRLTLTLSIAMLALTASGAQASVTVIGESGTRTISDAQITESADVEGRSYTVRGEGGQTSSQSVSGLSLPALLSIASVDSLSFKYLEVERTGGGSLLLSREQSTLASAFPDGPPVFYLDGHGNTVLLRPSSGSDDSNASDWISASNIVVNLRKGQLLQVSAIATPRKASAREAVSFRADLEQSAAGEPLTYSWYFDDGSSAQGQRVSHSFKQRGSYDVVVTVTTPSDSVGASSVVSVKVGTQSKGGPNRKGGGTDSSAFAPDSGSATGRTGGGASSQRVDSSSDSSQQAAQPKRKSKQDETQAGDDSKQVEGAILADENGNPLPPKAALSGVSGARAARTGSEAVSSGADIPPEVWALLCALGLVALGGVSERTGWLRRR